MLHEKPAGTFEHRDRGEGGTVFMTQVHMEYLGESS